MTKEQINISARNNRRAWKIVEEKLGWHGHSGFVLHHKNMNLKTEDIERYIEWNLKDLKVMTKQEHLSIHHTGLRYSDETKEKMRQRKLGVPKSPLHRQHLSEAHRLYWRRRKIKELNKEMNRGAKKTIAD